MPVFSLVILTTHLHEVKNVWSYISTPQYVFMEWYSVKNKKPRDEFTFTFTFAFFSFLNNVI
jgi:hypothetical protein